MRDGIIPDGHRETAAFREDREALDGEQQCSLRLGVSRG